MSIDWDKPIRTVSGHHPATVIAKDWKDLHSHLNLIAVRAYINGSDRFSVHLENGRALRGSFHLENVPDYRYVLYDKNNGHVLMVTRNSEEALEYFHLKDRPGQQIYRINLEKPFTGEEK